MKDRLTTAPQPMERPQCSCGTWNAPWRIWNGPQGFWNSPQGVSKKPLLHTRYTRNRGGNVEQSWCFRGERLRYRSSQVPNASAKLLLFSDMAMGCPGLRAVLVRIACNQPLVTPVTAVTAVTPRVFFFENCGIYRSLIILLYY